MCPRALVVDPDAGIRQLLRRHLELSGFTVDECGDGRAGLDRLRTTTYDVVLLEAVLPGLDGLTLCRAARASAPSSDAAILIVSTRDSEADKVLGLSNGADDYVAKPFGIRELLARVDAVLRRAGRQRAAGYAVSASVVLDAARREVLVRGRKVQLTRQEFDVLRQLAQCPGVVLSRAALLQQVWHGDPRASERTVDVAISRLRRKIEDDPRDPEMILTSWGVGYKLASA